MPRRTPPRPSALLAALGLAAAACGGSGGSFPAGTDGGPGPDGNSSFQPASHPALPQVVKLQGAVLAAPSVQPIVWASDGDRASIDDFFQELTRTTYWAATTSEYGVGALTIRPTIVLGEPAPASIDDQTLRQRLADNLGGASPAWGAADPQTIYLFALPSGTIGTATGDACCSVFDGYHDEVPIPGKGHVAYGVGCACPVSSSGVTELQRRTSALSHEAIEAATDPFPGSAPAFTQTDDADIVWTVVTGGEVADLCELVSPTLVIPKGAKYAVQRSWSNAAAKAGEDPCVPHTSSGLYLNTFLEATDTVEVSGSGTMIATRGVTLPVGQTKTVDVHLFSSAATSSPWTVTALDYSAALLGQTARLRLGLDKPTGVNGDVLHLSITPTSFDPKLGGTALLLVSVYGKPGDPGYQRTISLAWVAP